MRIPSWAVPLARWLRDYRLLYFRTVRVYECNVSAVATRKPAIEIEVFEAKEEDIRRLAALVSSAPADWIGRQARGSTCLIARAGSTYHGYLWITRGIHRVREVDHIVNVSRDPSGAYIHNVFVLNLRVCPRPYCWPLRHPSACRRNRGPPNDRHDPPAKLPALSRVLPQDGQRGPVRRLRYGALFEAARPPQSESDQDAAGSAMADRPRPTCDR